VTPLEDAAFHAVPLGVPGSEEGAGIAAARGRLGAALRAALVRAPSSARSSIRSSGSRSSPRGDRKQGRERTLLYNIINAVSDPILLTDTKGACSSPTRVR
jgi:hypothetical protein